MSPAQATNPKVEWLFSEQTSILQVFNKLEFKTQNIKESNCQVSNLHLMYSTGAL